MVTQALSGIAKDLTKMSSKSAVKLVVPDEGSLYRWVSVLTGSKNALKGVGFFLGGLLLTVVGFQAGLWILTVLVGGALAVVVTMMRGDLGNPNRQGEVQPDVLQQPSGQRAGGGADLPVRLTGRLVRHRRAGVPAQRAGLELLAGRRVPGDLGDRLRDRSGFRTSLPAPARATGRGTEPDGRMATWLAFALAAFPAAIAIALSAGADPALSLIAGLIIFGVIFAMNSAVHSYLILAYADGDKVAMNVGFYYMANAGGRLAGTILSGALYEWKGLEACLWASVVCVLAAGLISRRLPETPAPSSLPAGAALSWPR